MFPRDAVKEALGGSNYFTNSVSWLIGLAMLELQEAHTEWAEGKSQMSVFSCSVRT